MLQNARVTAFTDFELLGELLLQPRLSDRNSFFKVLLKHQYVHRKISL